MNIAFLPARCGSKSIPFKNIKELCGKPLIYWSLLSLEESRNIDIIYVATDCDKIASIVKEFDFKKVNIYLRDKYNATDEASTESVVLEFINKNNFNDNDIFYLVQATSPLTFTSDFDNAIIQYKQEKADSLLTCVRVKKFIWSNDGKALNYDYTNRPRRQDFDGLLIENGAFYISTIKNIKKYNNRIGGKITIYKMEEFQGVDIDEEDDWPVIEKLMQKYYIKL